MIQRFFARILSFFKRKAKPADPLAQFAHLPYAVNRDTTLKAGQKLNWYQRMAIQREQRRQERLNALARREKAKARPTNINTCVCGCGTKIAVKRGTLQFFVNKAHRKDYRKRYGAIDYGIAKA